MYLRFSATHFFSLRGEGANNSHTHRHIFVEPGRGEGGEFEERFRTLSVAHSNWCEEGTIPGHTTTLSAQAVAQVTKTES